MTEPGDEVAAPAPPAAATAAAAEAAAEANRYQEKS